MARNRTLLAIAAAVFAMAAPAGPAMAEDRFAQPTAVGQTIQPTEPASFGNNCSLINFTSAEVLTSPDTPPRHVLVVRGEKPYSNMQVKLVPLVYVQQPEYWGIEVVGCLSGAGLPVFTPYVVALDLEGTIGTRGVEVIGANRSEKIDVPSKAK